MKQKEIDKDSLFALVLVLQRFQRVIRTVDLIDLIVNPAPDIHKKYSVIESAMKECAAKNVEIQRANVIKGDVFVKLNCK